MYLYNTTAGFEMGRVSKYGSVLSSISSRMSVVAFTRVTKMRTTWRKSGIIRRWKRSMLNAETRPAAKDKARMKGIAERRSIAMTRRVPREFLVKCIGLPSADHKRVLGGHF